MKNKKLLLFASGAGLFFLLKRKNEPQQNLDGSKEIFSFYKENKELPVILPNQNILPTTAQVSNSIGYKKNITTQSWLDIGGQYGTECSITIPFTEHKIENPFVKIYHGSLNVQFIETVIDNNITITIDRTEVFDGYIIIK